MRPTDEVLREMDQWGVRPKYTVDIEMLRAMAAELLELREKTRWRKIETALPGEPGLFWLTHLGRFEIGTATGDGEADLGLNGWFAASHYMPLPEPPKEERDG